MYVDIEPNALELAPGSTGGISVRITNASSVIDAFRVTVFGLDPEWITTATPRLSLFPSESGVVEIEIGLPADFPAGHRQLSIHVQSANDPGDFALTQLSLVVIEQPRLTLRMDPVMVQGGTEATFGLVVTNSGNTTVTATPDGIDPEDKAEIVFLPELVELPPGHQDVIRATVKARRPWFGQPKVRVLTFAVDAHVRTETVATFLQKPRITRSLLSLLGLLAAAGVFAAVLSKTFDNVVNDAAVDQQVLSEALDQGAEGGNRVPVEPSSISGNVILATTEDPVAGVQAELFRADDTKVPIATAATSDQGKYSFPNLGAGEFKIRFSGAGFNELWYSNGTTAATAATVELAVREAKTLGEVKLGGRPGTVSGTIVADDPDGAVVTLLVPGQIEEGLDALVQSVDAAADGTFVFESVPSPARYQLVVQKPGYATEIRTVDLGPAETIDGIEVVLRRGDGVIRGTITGITAAGQSFPLGGATIEATDGTTTVSTVSLTEDPVGTFVLRGLPTPAVYSVTIILDGYRTETRTITLTSTTGAAAGDVPPVDVQLQRSTGSLSGTTTLAGDGALGGVTVTIAGGDTEITTVSATTGAVGTWFVDGLPLPATYTITFTRTGFVGQTRLQDLDPARGTVEVAGIDVSLVPDTATVRGVVRGVDDAPIARATVTLTNGTLVRTLSSADDPLGRFEFTGVAPGAYTLTAALTGTTPSVLLVNVTTAEVRELDIRLEAQASFTGQVLRLSPASNTYVPYAGATVRLFLPAAFPGAPSAAVDTKTTDANGNYTFSGLDAPQDYVIAVYANDASPEPLDSRLVLSQPSTQVTVPPFQIAQVN